MLHKSKERESLELQSGEYSIGTVSRMVNLSQKTLRDYEEMGLIKPKRAPFTNNRIYSDFEVAQIKRISYLIHNRGLTLPSIRCLLKLAPCWNVFDCKVKDGCPAYASPHIPCYEIREETETLCDTTCEQCGVFLNRRSRKQNVLGVGHSGSK